jgi:hypothetical protein
MEVQHAAPGLEDHLRRHARQRVVVGAITTDVLLPDVTHRLLIRI